MRSEQPTLHTEQPGTRAEQPSVLAGQPPAPSTEPAPRPAQPGGRADQPGGRADQPGARPEQATTPSAQSPLHAEQSATGAGQVGVPSRVPPICIGQPVTSSRPGLGHSATAVAHPNIALIKYWGKSDERLFLPRTDSLSMTLDIFPTTTRVRLAPEAGQDTVTFNGRPATGEAERRIIAFLELVRERAGRAERADVDTENTVPTGAGLASSASGFAALAVAAAAAYGLELDAADLSRLARRGSGSASRSIFGDFAIWHAGRTDGTPEEADLSSYAEPVQTAPLDPALVIAVVNAGPKEVSSRTAMRRTMDTSPLFEPWALSSKGDLADMRAALGRGDLPAVGEIAERNALGMHATMLAARPAVRYLSPATLTVLDSVLALRRDGVPAYATMDAGPNVKVLCRRADADRVAETVRAAAPGGAVHIAGPGPGARLLAEDGR